MSLLVELFNVWNLFAGIDNKKQISDRQKLSEIEKQHMEEEDDECRIFAAAKRKMAKLRMEKERQLHKYGVQFC